MKNAVHQIAYVLRKQNCMKYEIHLENGTGCFRHSVTGRIFDLNVMFNQDDTYIFFCFVLFCSLSFDRSFEMAFLRLLSHFFPFLKLF